MAFWKWTVMRQAKARFLSVVAVWLSIASAGARSTQDAPVAPPVVPGSSDDSLIRPKTQTNTGEASLKVDLRLEDESPFLGDAEVRLVTNDGQSVMGRPTGSPGETLFTELAPGQYRVEATAVGYADVEIRNEIAAGRRERTIYVVMKPRGLTLGIEEPKARPVAAQPVPQPAAANALLERVPPKSEWQKDFPILNELELSSGIVDSSVSCPSEKMLRGAGERMREFLSNLEKFTATEEVLHYSLGSGKHAPSPEKKRFSYLVTVSQNRLGTFLLEEDRNGYAPPSAFPGNVGTYGLPALALIFHPLMAGDFDFKCAGLGQAGGKPAWEVEFAQREDRPVRIRSYRVNDKTYVVRLKGRAWIDPGNYEVVRLETELKQPIPEIGLLAEHIGIDYVPVRFRSERSEIWLPHEADMYVEMKMRRYYRRHTFSDFKIFSVDTAQSVEAPKGSYSFINSSNYQITGVLTVRPGAGTSQKAVSVPVVVPARGKVFKVVGLGKDVNLPASAVESATFVHDGKADWMTVEANLVKETTLDVIPDTAVTSKP